MKYTVDTDNSLETRLKKFSILDLPRNDNTFTNKTEFNEGMLGYQITDNSIITDTNKNIQ